MTPIISPVRRRRLMLLMLLPFSVLCWALDTTSSLLPRKLIFFSVYKEVNQDEREDDVNPGQLMKTGVDAMLKTLDPYTNYYPEAEIEDYRMKHVSTNTGGIGASSFRMGDSIIIYNVYEGFPAQLADIRAGDVLLAVNGRSIKGLAPEEIDDLIKGQAGTTVKLGFSKY